jgi:hypothetical protein
MQSDTVLFKIYKLGTNKEHIFLKEYVIQLDEKIINIKNMILNELNQNDSSNFNKLEMNNITERIYKDFGKLFFDKGIVPDTIDNYKLLQLTNGNRTFSFTVNGKNIINNIVEKKKDESTVLKRIIKEDRERRQNDNKDFCYYEDDFPPLKV